MNEIENDLVDFLAMRTGQANAEVRQNYLVTKSRFQFAGPRYRKLCGQIHELFQVLYNESDENKLLESYRFHALPHLFRLVSYSFSKSLDNAAGPPAPQSTFRRKLSNRVRALESGDYRSAFSPPEFLRLDRSPAAPDPLFRDALPDLLSPPYSIIDYGCGMAYESFALAVTNPGSTVCLVDVDCLTLDFAEFRFRKRQLPFSAIRIDAACPYPKLPAHNVCIATEVMEHLISPLTAYKNIAGSMVAGGILHGDFDDHKKELFHVSPNLQLLRGRIETEFEKVGGLSYRKRSV